MKRILLIAMIICTGFLLTQYQIKQIELAQTYQFVKVVILKSDMISEEIVNLDDLTYGEVKKEFISQDYIQNKDEIVGKKMKISLNKNSILSKSMLYEEIKFSPQNGNAITSLKLSPDESMCWEINIGEEVNIVHIDSEGNLKILGKVTLQGLYDNDGENSKTPSYALIEGKQDVILKVVHTRENGRLEIIKTSY